MTSQRLLVMSLAILGSLLVPTSAFAATIDVTVTTDTVADDGECSLREAVTATNLNADVGGADDCDHDASMGADTVALPEPPTQYSLAGPAGENANAGGDLDVEAGTGGLTIEGAGAVATPIDAGDIDRVLDLESGALVLKDLALRDGDVAGSGGGVRAEAGSGSLTLTRVNVVSNEAGTSGGGVQAFVPLTITGGNVASNRVSADLPSGGGIAAFDTTQIVRGVISGNSVVATAPGVGANVDGGGIAQGFGGPLTVVDSSVQGNSVTVNDSSDFPIGGGISADNADLAVARSVVKNNSLSGGNIRSGAGVDFVDGAADDTATLANTTITNNDAGPLSGPPNSLGGGLNVFRGVTELSNVTIAGNEAEAGKAIYYQQTNQAGSALRLRGTILSEGGGTECGLPSGDLTTLGYNVDEGTSCYPADGTSLRSTDPQLNPVASNGGPTSTMALPATSPAINLMPPAQCEDTDGSPVRVDQRRVPRPFGAGCEPGAYERSICRGFLVGAGAIIGTPAADELTGTPAGNVIVAGAGNDVVAAGAGNDRACGGRGGDTLRGATGSDRLAGEAGADTLAGGKDTDNCNGGPGTDSASGCEVKKSIP